MATIGSAQLNKSVFEFFDAVRSYDAKRAAAVLAEDADYESPWSGGKRTGKARIEEHLKAWLGDAKTRPTLTIKDLAGDGNVTRLTISVSGRMGKASRVMRMDVLCLKGQIHHVKVHDPAH